MIHRGKYKSTVACSSTLFILKQPPHPPWHWKKGGCLNPKARKGKESQVKQAVKLIWPSSYLKSSKNTENCIIYYWRVVRDVSTKDSQRQMDLSVLLTHNH